MSEPAKVSDPFFAGGCDCKKCKRNEYAKGFAERLTSKEDKDYFNDLLERLDHAEFINEGEYWRVKDLQKEIEVFESILSKVSQQSLFFNTSEQDVNDPIWRRRLSKVEWTKDEKDLMANKRIRFDEQEQHDF